MHDREGGVSMKTKKKMLRLGALFAAVLMLAAAPGDAYAAENKGNTGVSGSGAAGSTVIDPEIKGSLTIYKYDRAKQAQVQEALQGPEGAAEESLQEYAVEGVEFTYYRVAGFETLVKETAAAGEDGILAEGAADKAGKRVVTVTPVFRLEDQELKGILGLDGDAFTSTELNRALGELYSKTGGTGTDPVPAKNRFEQYIAGNGSASGGTVMAPTDRNGKTSAAGLDTGLYLVVETKVPTEVVSTVNPFFVSVPVTNKEGNGWEYDVTIYPKNQLETEENRPDLKKEVRKAKEGAGRQEGYGKEVSASGWDTLEYRLVSRLPEITSEATYLTEYMFTDVMGDGLSYVEDSFRISVYEPEEAQGEGPKEETDGAETGEGWNLKGEPVKVWPPAGGPENPGGGTEAYFRVEFAEGEEAGTRQAVITLTEKGLQEINPGCSGKYMVVEYQAELTGKAVPGEANKNRAVLRWNRSGKDPETIASEDTAVYTYGIRLEKTFLQGETALDIEAEGLEAEQVKFLLKKGEEYVEMKRRAADASGAHPEGGGAEADSACYDAAGLTQEPGKAVFSPGKDGILYVYGLEEGSYTLTETETLKDYALLVNDVGMEITKETTAESGGFLEVGIINRRLPYLLNTGGIGILPFLAGGGLLILGGAVLLWKRRNGLAEKEQ